MRILLCGDRSAPMSRPCCCSKRSTVRRTASDYKVFDKRGLRFVYVNTRSLLARFDEECLIAQRTKAAGICVSESWMDASVPDIEVSIPNWCIQRNDRTRHGGGGVCLYSHSDLSYNERSEFFMRILRLTGLNCCCQKLNYISGYLQTTKPKTD